MRRSILGHTTHHHANSTSRSRTMAQSSLPSQQALWVHRAKRCRQHNTAAEKVAVTCWGMCPRPCQKMHAHQRGEVTTTHILLQGKCTLLGSGAHHTHTHAYVNTHCAFNLAAPAKSPEPKVSHTSSTAAAASHSSPRSGAHFFSWQGDRNTRAYHGTTLLLSASKDSYTRSLKAAAVGFEGSC